MLGHSDGSRSSMIINNTYLNAIVQTCDANWNE
jgi:hypothetical protein